jgi:hypothetical protein
MQYPAVEKIQYSEILTQRYGFVEEANRTRVMSPARLAAQLRELARHHRPCCCARSTIRTGSRSRAACA